MSTGQGQYSIGLDKTPANFVPLSPLSFLERSASVYPGMTSTVYEGRTFTWAQTYERCKRFASFLVRNGIGRGDTVAAMLPNIPAMNELHFAVPMTGAVLNALNIRLDAASIAFMLSWGLLHGRSSWGSCMCLARPNKRRRVASSLWTSGRGRRRLRTHPAALF